MMYYIKTKGSEKGPYTSKVLKSWCEIFALFSECIVWSCHKLLRLWWCTSSRYVCKYPFYQCIAGNLWRRKHSQISCFFFGYSQKFSLRNLGVWHSSVAQVNNLWKFSLWKLYFSPIRESLYLESFPPYGIQWNPSIADIINWDQQFGPS